MHQRTYTLLILLAASIGLAAQQSIVLSGVVTTEAEPLPLASLILKDAAGESIIAFTYSDKGGAYRMTVDTSGNFQLIASALGYGADTVRVTFSSGDLTQHFQLTATAFEFRAITVEAKRVIAEKKDTVIIDAQTFAEGDEEVVEDLLRRIPGLTVAGDGVISVDGQEVDRVLIEGDDMFERGYRMLTKNLPSYPIESVEILRNYSRNRLLKDIEDRQRVAINLTLQEQYQRVWSGNARLGYGPAPAERYRGQVNLMNFGRKNKYYFLGAANNTGANTAGNISYLLRPQRRGEPDEIGADVANPELISFGGRAPDFSAGRTLLNNDELLSANAVLTPFDKLKVKVMAFANGDENYFRERGLTVLLPPGEDEIALPDSSYARRAPITLGGRLEVTYQLAKTTDLRYTARLSREAEAAEQQNLFNGLPRTVDLYRDASGNDHHLNLTHRLSGNSVLSTSMAHIDRNLGTRVRAQNSFLFSGQPNAFTQDVNTRLRYTGASSHYLYRSERGHVLESRVSLSRRKDELPVAFLNTPEITRAFEYERQDVLGELLYKYKIGRFRLVGQLEGGRRNLQLADAAGTAEISPWVLNPMTGFEYREGQKHRLNVALLHTQNPTSAEQNLTTPLALGFRRLQLGTAVPINLKTTSLGLRYQRGSWSDRFFFTLTGSLAHDHDYLTGRRTVGVETERNQWYRATGRNRGQAKVETNYFLKKWRINLRADLSANFADLEDELNGLRRGIQQRQLNQLWSFRTASVGKFNFGSGHGIVRKQVRTTAIQQATEYQTFADFTYQIHKRFILSARAEHYVFRANTNRSQQTFLDMELRYTPRGTRLNYTLSARNLFGGGAYRSLSVTDFSQVERTYAIQPATVMARVEWRFR